MMTCPECGFENVPGTAFCEECGHTLLATATLPQRHSGDFASPAPSTDAPTARAQGPVPGGDAAGQQEQEHDAVPAGRGAETAAAPPEESRVPAAAPSSGAYLLTDRGRRLDVPLQDIVIVGREDMRSGIRPDVDLTLDGGSAAGVSRRHCRLLRGQNGWHVEDLMSTNRTVLNGKALAPHTPTLLHDGDELRLGKLRLRFHNNAPATQ